MGVSLMLASILLLVTAGAHGKWKNPEGHSAGLFRHIGTFDVMAGNGSGVAEIIDFSEDGRQLIYTDAETESIGFVDIADPSQPTGQGIVRVDGEPTSLVILGPWVLVGVNTSGGDFDNPTGKLVVVNRHTHHIVATHELGGQPDSIALAPDHQRAAIVIENERDEDQSDGLIDPPQLPSGKLLIVRLNGHPKNWSFTEADLSPVAATSFAGADLEPEFVDINKQNEAVVSFQENNHLAVINLKTGKVINHFSAGSVALNNVDTEEEGLIQLDTHITKRREPDAVAWIDHDSFATANEGDYEDESGEEGGSRGFTIFNQDGTVEFESAESFEHWLVRAGHYLDGRSENKGCEPEAVESETFGHRTLLFVGSERCNAVGVYDVTTGSPEPLQLLPTGMGPEGLKAFSKNTPQIFWKKVWRTPGDKRPFRKLFTKQHLFAASTESEEAGDGIPTMITLYHLDDGPASYPMIVSGDDSNGLPIPWVALSGLVGDPTDAHILYAVSDAFLAEGFIYKIDASRQPAAIVERLQITGASATLDPESIAIGPDGHFWVGSEGNDSSRPNLVLKIDSSTGAVLNEITLPADLVDMRRGNGIEGIAVTGTAGAEFVYVAIQRAWPNEGDTDKVNTKIGRYQVATGDWGFVHYPLEPEGVGDWIGLSELTLLPNGAFAVIERDKGWGPTTGFNAELKAIYGVDLATAEFRAFDDPSGLVTIGKSLLRDVLPDLEAVSIWTAEKLEGLAVTADGQVYIVTDNDGVDGATGETIFLNLGDWETAFAL